MKEFFKVMDLNGVIQLAGRFGIAGTEVISLGESSGRVLAEDIRSDMNLPEFTRSTMDGFAVSASSTFGASTGSPAWLTIKGSIAMGEVPSFSIGPGEAAGIATGGMLPEGADGVVMIEHTEAVDETAIEVYRSIAPGQNVIERGEDFRNDAVVLEAGTRIRPQESGLMAAFGRERIQVYKKPVISIISTGDEVVGISETPPPGHIRDINTYTLSSMVTDAGGIAVPCGIIRDDVQALRSVCETAIETSDMVLISGGSSVGTRDFTVDVLTSFPDSEILVHGISISPGKPTILASVQGKAIWGLPGHVVSAMVVFEIVVKPFIETFTGKQNSGDNFPKIKAALTRNVPSAQGRVDFIRVKLTEKDGMVYAEPVLGKSGMINTMVLADGLIQVPLNTEGLDKGTEVRVHQI